MTLLLLRDVSQKDFSWVSDTEEETDRSAGVNLREAMAAFQQRAALRDKEAEEDGAGSEAVLTELPPPAPQPMIATGSPEASPVEETGVWAV